LPEDSLGFVRRSCPNCARHFKTKALPREDAVVQSTFTELLKHANTTELTELPYRFCPYCGTQSAAQVFLTELQRGYIESWAKSVTSIIRYERLRLPSKHLNQNPYVTYLPVEPLDTHVELPPEPDDMDRWLLMCCGEEQKLLTDWAGEFFCHFCRARHAK
jgi:hypothetical protein